MLLGPAISLGTMLCALPLGAQVWALPISGRSRLPFAWGNDSLPAPLIAFPDHLVRLRERVAWELQHNPAVQYVVVLLSVPRATLDRSTSWATFVREVDPALLQGWGSGLGIEEAVGFAEPLQLQRYPLGATVVPPLMWETAPLPCKFAADIQS